MLIFEENRRFIGAEVAEKPKIHAILVKNAFCWALTLVLTKTKGKARILKVNDKSLTAMLIEPPI